MINSVATKKIHAVVSDCLQSRLELNSEKHASRNKLVLGYSGGLDSRVLLQVLHELNNLYSMEYDLIAIHVNHGLQKDAKDWQQHCQQTAENLGIGFFYETVKIDTDTSDSIEELARNARYEVFARYLDKGDVLCLAHHQEDQAETFMLRLLRGSGSLGLSSMQVSSLRDKNIVLRPMLNLSKKLLTTYAHEHNLQWVEDPSNLDLDYDRNYLRHKIMPLLEQRWESVSQRFSRSAELNAEASKLLDVLADQDMALVCKTIDDAPLTKNQKLEITGLKNLENDRRLNVIRYWLRSLDLSLPSRVKLRQINRDILEAADDGEPCVSWAGAEIRRFRNYLYAMEPLPVVGGIQVSNWNLQKAFKLAEGLGELSSTLVSNAGLRKEEPGEQVSVRYRQGGERCKPVGRSGSQTLKKLFQEYDIPPWERHLIPLIYYNDQLAAVPGKWVCEGFDAQSGQNGYLLSWKTCT